MTDERLTALKQLSTGNHNRCQLPRKWLAELLAEVDRQRAEFAELLTIARAHCKQRKALEEEIDRLRAENGDLRALGVRPCHCCVTANGCFDGCGCSVNVEKDQDNDE